MTAAGTQIADPTVILYRQVQPLHFPLGRLSSGAFVPGPKHKGLLSTRHEAIGAKRAYEEFIAVLDDEGNPYESCGTWSVTVDEVEQNGVCEGIAAYLDECIDGNPEGHVSIDFNSSPSPTKTKRIARHLARCGEFRAIRIPVSD